MRMPIAHSLIAVLLLSTATLAADKHPLQGVWIVESAEFRGKKIDELKGNAVEFSGNKFVIEFGGEKKTNTYKTDDSKKPKQLDVVDTSAGVAGGMVSQAIYKIDGDTLTICTGGGSAETKKAEIKPGERPSDKPPETIYKSDLRPTAFDSSKAALMVLKRKK